MHYDRIFPKLLGTSQINPSLGVVVVVIVVVFAYLVRRVGFRWEATKSVYWLTSELKSGNA